MLPNFLILGGPRCGSTWLANVLSQHPQVHIPRLGLEYATGDIHFFDVSKQEGKSNHALGLEWYKNLFKFTKTSKRIGEKTADYLADPCSPKLIYKTLGKDVRLIACLRDPISRAYSHYWHERPNLPFSMSFERAFFDTNINKKIWLQNSGLYYANINRYLETFSKDNLLLLLSEEMWKYPAESLCRICRFLDIDHEFIFSNSASPVNKGVATGLIYYMSLGAGWLRRYMPRTFSFMRDSKLAYPIREKLRTVRNIPSSERHEHTVKIPDRENVSRKIDNAIQIRLMEFYYADVSNLSKIIEKDMPIFWWKQEKYNRD